MSMLRENRIDLQEYSAGNTFITYAGEIVTMIHADNDLFFFVCKGGVRIYHRDGTYALAKSADYDIRFMNYCNAESVKEDTMLLVRFILELKNKCVEVNEKLELHNKKLDIFRDVLKDLLS